MAGGKVRSVSVVFQAFTDKFEKKVDRAGGKMAGFGKKVLAGVGGFLAARATISKFTQSFQDLDRIAKLSDRLEVNPNFLRGLDLAATQTGTAFSSVEKGVQKMARTIGEARADIGEGKTAFKELGLAIEDFDGLSVEDQFKKISTLIAGIEDPAQKIAAANKIFGRSGQELINLLNQGEKGLEAFRKEAEALGGPISKEDLRQVEEANDAMDKMGRAWDGIIQQLSIQLAPVVTWLADAFKGMLQSIREFGETWSQIQEDISNFILNFDFLLGVELTDEEREFAKSLDSRRFGSDDTKTSSTANFKGGANGEIKAKISNIKTFVDAISMGSSEAFKALNPTQQVDTQKQMVTEQKQTNTTLKAIETKIGTVNANVVDI